jgi:hypothetical protein
MSTRCHSIFVVVLAGLSVTLGACGSADPGAHPEGSSVSGKGRGYVQCGAFTCSPGQYCENFACLNGCTSDDNCKEGTSCTNIDAMMKVGTCTETTPPGDSGVPSNTCSGKFQQLVTCGLIEAFEAAALEEACAETWTDSQIKVVDACVQAWATCSKPIPTCLEALGLKCGPSYPCATGTCATAASAGLGQAAHQCY